jgi:hypothetical protein
MRNLPRHAQRYLISFHHQNGKLLISPVFSITKWQGDFRTFLIHLFSIT